MSARRITSKGKEAVIFIAMAAITAAIGLGIGFFAAFIGASILRESFAGFGALVGALSGITIGYPVGVIIGIVVVKKRLHYEGRLWYGVLGVILGTLLTIGLAEPLNLNLNTNLLVVTLLVAPPLVGMVFFRFIHFRVSKRVAR